MKKLLIIPIIFLIGCGSETISEYGLSVPSVKKVSYSKFKNKTLKIDYVRFIQDKDTDKIKYSYSKRETGYYENSIWSNNLSKLIEGSITKTLFSSNVFKSVNSYSSNVSEDLVLETSIFDFTHYIHGKDSYALISIKFSLVNKDNGKVIKEKIFTYRENTPTLNADGFVIASNKIIAKLNNELVYWIRR